MPGSIATLADLTPAAAAAAGDTVALVGVDRSLTWTDAEAEIGGVASALASLGVRPGDRVAVAMRKTEHSFLAVHAIQRCGGVVVPVDPLAPAAAVAAVVADAEPSAVIGDQPTLATMRAGAAASLPTIVVGPAEEGNGVPWTDAVASRATPLDAVRPMIRHTSSTRPEVRAGRRGSFTRIAARWPTPNSLSTSTRSRMPTDSPA